MVGIKFGCLLLCVFFTLEPLAYNNSTRQAASFGPNGLGLVYNFGMLVLLEHVEHVEMDCFLFFGSWVS